MHALLLESSSTCILTWHVLCSPPRRCVLAASAPCRADFNTDEEWQAYKENKETLPKAAFQFGVKRGDGRKNHKQLQKGMSEVERANNQKIDSQLRKIEKIMEEKGHSHGDAFKRPPKEMAPPSVRGSGSGGQRGDETPSMRKRMRL